MSCKNYILLKMNTKQNFFDQLDGGWGDLIADTYKKTINSYTLEFTDGKTLFKFKPTKKGSNSTKIEISDEYTKIEISDEILTTLERITFLNINEPENFDISRNFRKETETYTIKTNIKSVLINGIPLMDILFSESNIDKKNTFINLISTSTIFIKNYNEYPDTTITFDLIIYENRIEIYSNILGSLFNLKDNSDLKIILDKVK